MHFVGRSCELFHLLGCAEAVGERDAALIWIEANKSLNIPTRGLESLPLSK